MMELDYWVQEDLADWTQNQEKFAAIHCKLMDKEDAQGQFLQEGRQIFFEKVCAVSCYLTGVNPFNQPGVEAYKSNIKAALRGE